MEKSSQVQERTAQSLGEGGLEGKWNGILAHRHNRKSSQNNLISDSVFSVQKFPLYFCRTSVRRVEFMCSG